MESIVTGWLLCKERSRKSREKKGQQYRIPQDADQKDVKKDGNQRCQSSLVPSCQSVKTDAEKSGPGTIL
jgi:hypothetical protein